MLTAGQYLNDIKAARKGLDDFKPLLALNEDRGYEAVRVELRKAPVSGIRKACSKLITLLPEGSATAKAKTKIYDDIKKELGQLDDGCREGVSSRPDLLAIVEAMQANLDAMGTGLGVTAAE